MNDVDRIHPLTENECISCNGSGSCPCHAERPCDICTRPGYCPTCAGKGWVIVP